MMKRGGGSDADQKKTYDTLTDPVGLGRSYTPRLQEALRQQERGIAQLSAHALRERGRNFQARRLNEDSLQFFNQAIRVTDPSLHVSYVDRGNLHASLNRWDEALYDARKAVTMNRDYAKGYLLMGNALLKLQRGGEALQVFKRGVKRNPGNKDLQAGLERACRNADNQPAASFNDAKDRGDEARRSEKYLEAARWYCHAIFMVPEEDTPSLESVLVSRAECWKNIGDVREVIADCDEAIALGVTKPSVFLMRGESHATLGNHADALNDFLQASQIDPKNQVAANSLEHVKKMMQLKKAERTAEQTKDEVLRAKAMQELKSMEAERKAKTQEKLAKAAHMDPDGLQYFTKHYGYW